MKVDLVFEVVADDLADVAPRPEGDEHRARLGREAGGHEPRLTVFAPGKVYFRHGQCDQ